MLLIFLLIYIASFILTCREVWRGNNSGILIFMIFGLSMYVTAMSVAFTYGLKDLIPLLQSFKEGVILFVLILNIAALRQRPRFHIIDYVIFAFLLYVTLYAILPIGDQGLVNRLMALKSMAFYIVVYFTGRLIDPKTVYVNKYFTYIILLAIATAAVLLIEVATKTPLQFVSGYFDYSYYFYNLEAEGPFGLKATFNSDTGFTRYASFFTSPLEHAGATVIALAVVFGLYTRDDNKFNINSIGIIALGAILLSIFYSLSRAPMASCCIMIYVYALLTKRKLILNTIHTVFAIAAIYVIYLFVQFEQTNNSIMAVVLNTIDFSDPSSVGHLAQWVEGITSIAIHPFGLGMGTSGRVAASTSENVGGENQYIIIAVQAGLIAAFLYLLMFIMFVKIGLKWLPLLKGKERKVCMAVLFIKVGFFLSTLTSEVESSTYLSYLNWFLSGLLISIIMQPKATQTLPVYDHRENN